MKLAGVCSGLYIASNHLLYNPKLVKIVIHVHPICMLRLSINSYLDDTAHELSWSKLSDFSVQTFLKLIITSQTTAQSYLCWNRPQNGQFFSKNIVQTSKKVPPIMEKVEPVFLLHDVIKTCMESYWKKGIKMLLASGCECLIEV